MSSRTPPLAGLKVVDLSRVVSGPLCGRILADLGAEVIKIEPPDGDTTRRVPPFVGGTSAYYAQMNAGKRNVGVDLKAPGGATVVARMAASADVLIENFRPGVLARFGLDADTLLRDNPRLVYCSVTGWGQRGPWRDRRAYAPLVHADVGGLDLAARMRGRKPEPEVNQHGDVYTAVMAANAVLAALVQRGVTGRGQHLDVAMGQAAVYVNEWAAVALQEPADEYGGFDTWNHHTYPLGDASYVALVGNPVNLFLAWVQRLGGPQELQTDERFATREARSSHVAEMVQILDELTSRFDDFDALAAVLDPSMLAAQVRSVADLAATEWASHRGLTRDVVPGLPVPAAPWLGSESVVGAVASVPALGADNRVVLAGVGYSEAEIEQLEASGALHSDQIGGAGATDP